MSRGIEKIKKIINRILKKDKWKAYLYYKNQQIKKIYVDKEDKVFSNIYIVNIYFKKHLFGSFFTNTMFVAKKIKFINKEAKKIYIEVDNYLGGDI